MCEVVGLPKAATPKGSRQVAGALIIEAVSVEHVDQWPYGQFMQNSLMVSL